MNRMGTFLLALLPLGAMAQGGLIAGDEPACYNWQGGNHSAGSFSKCAPRWPEVKAKPPVVAAALPAPVVVSPVMMPQSAPQVISCAPLPKPITRPKRKPAPRC